MGDFTHIKEQSGTKWYLFKSVLFHFLNKMTLFMLIRETVGQSIEFTHFTQYFSIVMRWRIQGS